MNEITPRKRQILKLWRAGCTDEEIGHRLTISYGTVRQHAYNLFEFLSLQRAFRLLAIAKATERGYIDGDMAAMAVALCYLEAAISEIETVINGD
jgi:DNA-binding NarL/FixJ family response regulator